MIELKIVKEQYERMPDEELIRFAINESQHLTLESFHLLKTEFESRNLDIGVLEEVEIDEKLAEINKQSTFELATSIEYTEMIWKFALEEKEKGKSNTEILHSLMERRVEENYAGMLIETLESKSKDLVNDLDNEIVAAWIVLCAGLIAVILGGSGAVHGIIALYGLIAIIGGVIRLSRSYPQKKKYETVVSNIEDEKEQLNNLYQ